MDRAEEIRARLAARDHGDAGGIDRSDADAYAVATFAHHAPTDIAWALEEIARLRTEVERARDAEAEWCLAARDAMRRQGLDGDDMAEILRKMESEMDFWRLAADHFRNYVMHRTSECTRTGICTCGLIGPIYDFGPIDGADTPSSSDPMGAQPSP